MRNMVVLRLQATEKASIKKNRLINQSRISTIKSIYPIINKRLWQID